MAWSSKLQAQPATRAESIVSPAWVKALLDFQTGNGARPNGYANNRFVILETSWAIFFAQSSWNCPGQVFVWTREEIGRDLRLMTRMTNSLLIQNRKIQTGGGMFPMADW
ncbi:MAG: hypothetical protein SF097_22560 [Acidobacteriota bacterium]|nr:hypothetical protein [Acidobacteriota bacterium]